MHGDFAKLRLLVLAAGELVKPPWWPTQFLTPTGQRFLERLYPRTALSAAINASTIAACRVHDGSIGKGRVFHLFRLPPSIEAEMRRRIFGGYSTDLSHEYKDAFGDPDKLLEKLVELSGGPAPKTAQGPLRMGKAESLTRSDAPAKAAAVYLTAFRNKTTAFPFWEELE